MRINKLLIVFFLLGVFTLCQHKNKLIIGTGDYTPFEFYDSHGKLSGYDIELGERIAKELNLEIEWKTFHFQDLFFRLEDNTIDAIIAAIHITPERKKKYLFSIPYLNTGLVFITNKNNHIGSDIDDFKNKRIAAKVKATGANFLLENRAKYFFEVVQYSETSECFYALSENKVDAVLSDYLSARNYLKSNPSFKIATTPFNYAGLGIVAKLNNKPLIERINKVLTKLEENGFLHSLYIKWLL